MKKEDCRRHEKRSVGIHVRVFPSISKFLKENKLFIIDFGLGKNSQKIEDQAVDLYVLYEALRAAHFKVLDKTWETVLNIYKHNYTKSKEVLTRLEKIKKRRRYLNE